MIRDPTSVNEALGNLGLVHVYFARFQMMNWSLHLLLTGRDFHDVKAHLFLANCDFICGKTLSGPVTLSLAVRLDGDQDVVVLSATPAGLKVEATSVAMADPKEVEWPPQMGNVPDYER